MINYKVLVILVGLIAISLLSGCSLFMPGSFSSGEANPFKSLALSRAPRLDQTAELVFSNAMGFYNTGLFKGGIIGLWTIFITFLNLPCFNMNLKVNYFEI